MTETAAHCERAVTLPGLTGLRTAGLAIAIGLLGVFVVHVIGFEYQPMPSAPLPALMFYLVTGVGALATLPALGLIALMPVGLAMTIYQVGRSLAGGAARILRWLVHTGWRHLVASTLPGSAAVATFACLALATGGVDAIWFWSRALAWSVPVLVGIGLLVVFAWMPLSVVALIVGELVRPLGSLAAETAEIWTRRVLAGSSFVVGFGVVAIPVAAENAAIAPANIPFAGSGWATFVVGLLGAMAVALAWRTGSRLGSRLAPPPSPAPSPPPPGQEVFWSPEPVVGWRTWAWTEAGLHGFRTAWPDDTLAAACASCVEIPGWSHTCGIYAVKEPRLLSSAFLTASGQAELVRGKVEMSGLVIEHEHGYRAQQARIVELAVPPHLVEAAGARYPEVVVIPVERGALSWPT